MIPQPPYDINGFTASDALAHFGAGALNSLVISRWITEKLHPDNAGQCPVCHKPIISPRAMITFITGGRVKCTACKKFYNNRTNTILHASPLSFEQIYLIAVLSAFATHTKSDRSTTRREIAQIVGLHPDSIGHWIKIFSALETPLVR